MKTRIALVLAVAAILGSLAWMWWPDRQRIQDPTPIVQTSGASELRPPTTEARHEAERPASPAHLAQSSAPITRHLIDQLSSLEEQSVRGNKHASCLLAIELRRCSDIGRLRTRARELERNAAGQAPGSENERRDVEQIAQLQDEISQRALYCEGITNEQSREAWRYYQRAASQGHLDAAIEYVVAPPLDRRNMLRDIDAWAAYRNSYWTHLQHGIRNGDVRALFLAFGISAGTDFVTGAPDDTTHHDDLLAATYGHALVPMLAEPDAQRIRAMLDRVRARLEPDALHQAETEGARLRDSTFINQPIFNARGALRRTLKPDDC